MFVKIGSVGMFGMNSYIVGVEASIDAALPRFDALNTELKVPADARYLTIVGSAHCQVEGATHVSSQGLIHTYRLNQDAAYISIRASRQYGTKVYEAIFR